MASADFSRKTTTAATPKTTKRHKINEKNRPWAVSFTPFSPIPHQKKILDFRKIFQLISSNCNQHSNQSNQPDSWNVDNLFIKQHQCNNTFIANTPNFLKCLFSSFIQRTKWQSIQLLQNLIKDVETLGAGANEIQSFAASFIVPG
jgi:hypothetical protein